jgi:type VI protein secretion system component VasK
MLKPVSTGDGPRHEAAGQRNCSMKRTTMQKLLLGAVIATLAAAFSTVTLARVERPEKAEKPEKVEKVEKAEKPEKREKIEKAEKPEKREKAEKPEKHERPEKVGALPMTLA